MLKLQLVCELPCRTWEQNPGSLQVLLSTSHLSNTPKNFNHHMAEYEGLGHWGGSTHPISYSTELICFLKGFSQKHFVQISFNAFTIYNVKSPKQTNKNPSNFLSEKKKKLST